MVVYEVDLIERKTGNSIVCIYSGDEHDVACEIADTYNKTLPDYNEYYAYGDYQDGKSDGLYANVFICESVDQILGIGKI